MFQFLHPGSQLSVEFLSLTNEYFDLLDHELHLLILAVHERYAIAIRLRPTLHLSSVRGLENMEEVLKVFDLGAD